MARALTLLRRSCCIGASLIAVSAPSARSAPDADTQPVSLVQLSSHGTVHRFRVRNDSSSRPGEVVGIKLWMSGSEYYLGADKALDDAISTRPVGIACARCKRFEQRPQFRPRCDSIPRARNQVRAGGITHEDRRAEVQRDGQITFSQTGTALEPGRSPASRRCVITYALNRKRHRP